MLSRRQFHAGLLGSLGALTLPRLALAAPPPDLWLNRLTFGATDALRGEFTDLGLTAWLDDQLTRPPQDDMIGERLQSARLQIAYEAGNDENGHTWPALDELRPLAALTADPASLTHLIDWDQGMDFGERIRPAQEVIAAALIRAVHAPAQLREVMTQFWHDHFSVNALKDEFTAAFFASHDAALRTHALGNFRDLLGAVARQPAMLYYLNNADSRASPANENYARELLELHTLGAENYLNDRYDDWHSVPGASEGLAQGYLDLDVYEVARAFTGWSVGDGRYVTTAMTRRKPGSFTMSRPGTTPIKSACWGSSFRPTVRRWPMVSRCWTSLPPTPPPPASSAARSPAAC